MAEVVGLVARVIAMLGVAKTASKCAKYVYKAARDVRSISSELELFAIQLETFGDSVGLARVALSELFSEKSTLNKDSQVVRYMEKQGVVEKIELAADKFRDRIEVFWDKIEQLRGGSWLASQMSLIKWTLFNKDDLPILGAQMESIKTNLNLVMTTLKLAEVKCSPKTAASDGLMKLLERSIEGQMKTMQLLAQSQVSRATPTLEESETLEASDEFARTTQELLDLARSIKDESCLPNGQPIDIPQTPRRHHSNPSAAGHQRRRNAAAERPTATERFMPSPPGGRPQPLRRQSRNPSIRSPQPPVNPSTPQDRPDGEWPERPPPAFHPPPQTPPTGSTNNPISPISRVSPGSSPPGESTAASSTARPESDFMSVRARETILVIQRKHNSPVEGYIMAPGSSEQRKFSGHFNADLEENVISTTLARQVGLKIHRREFGDPTTVQFPGDGRNDLEIQGSVEVKWYELEDMGKDAPGFGIRMWVCPPFEEGLIMGKPFRQKRSYYRAKNQGKV